MTIKKLYSIRAVRFALVGVANTAIDFAIFNALMAFLAGSEPSHKEVLIYNTISATIVACISFFLNRQYVFKSKDTPHSYAILFILITLSGLYIVQNGIIFLVGKVPELATPAISVLGWAGISINRSIILANIGKLIGTAGSMVWNYVLYKHTVFRNQK